MVDLFADRGTFRTNEFMAEGGVRLLDTTNQLTCDRLEAREGMPQAPEKIAIATGHVIVARAGGSIVADRADYTEADGALVFTGEPHWRIEQNTGVAERLTIRTRTGEVLAENNVKVTVPLGPGTGSFLSFFPGDAVTNSVPTVIEAAAHSFLAATNGRRVTFTGDVRVHQSPHTGSEPKLQSDELELRFSTNARPSIERLEARRNVIYEQGMAGVTNGPATHRQMTARTLTADANPATGKLVELVADGGVKLEEPGTQATGDRAVYTSATDTFRLTGKTVLETPDMIITESPEVYWSRAEKKFVARGPYVIKVKPGALKRAGESQKLP
jgi:lipopolysaccharide export system protein LptA